MTNPAHDTFPAWVTTLSLESGIQEITARVTNSDVIWFGIDQYTFTHKEGLDWHRTREDAVKRAEEMRAEQIAGLRKSIANHRTKEGAVIRAKEMMVSRISSLQNSIAKLEKMSFK